MDLWFLNSFIMAETTIINSPLISMVYLSRKRHMNLSCATIIAGFLFGLAFILAPPSATASISRFQNEESININTAPVEELQRLPGIGPALASRIVEHRRRHGPFKRPQDVVIVRGMSEKLYRRIAHLIRV
jgi:competence ComEA-like helix-hairpin-helix protein